MRNITIGILLAIVATSSLAADATERRFISKGMAEGEVLVKIGKPDSESEVSGGGAKDTEKVWTYLPNDDDSQTLTTITIKGGKVISVDRSVSR